MFLHCPLEQLCLLMSFKVELNVKECSFLIVDFVGD